MNLYQDERVLDVAAGNGPCLFRGRATLVRCDRADCAPDLMSRHATRPKRRNLGVRFVDADAEALPFADQSFDAVLSTFGAMFALDQDRASAEMIRVCRRGGCVGLANWTPDGFIGAIVRRHRRLRESARGPRPVRVGHRAAPRRAVWRLWPHRDDRKKCRIPGADSGRMGGPVSRELRARAQVVRSAGCRRQRALRGDLLELVTRFNRAKDGGMVVDAEYLEVVVTRR